MQCSEGAERDRYVNIYTDLVSTNKKLVHDHAEIIDELPKNMTYKEYLKYKESTYENKKDIEKGSMDLG